MSMELFAQAHAVREIKSLLNKDLDVLKWNLVKKKAF